MPFTINGFDHKGWEEHSLADFGDFADMITECNVRTWGDDTTSGNWFYIPDEVLPPMQGVDYGGVTPNERAIYFGSWGNDNSPGASMYTNAEIFDMDDEDDVAAFEMAKNDWEEYPEEIESEDEDEDSEDDESDDEEDAVEYD